LTLNFPDKKYKTIVIDPPWDLVPVSNFCNNVHFKFKESLPYKTMTNEELCNFPINCFADNECQLFLWVTQATLPFGFKLIKAWGFKYHCLLTWDKTKGITMWGFNRRTEYIIFAFKGKIEIKQKNTSISTFFRERSTQHSVKPKIFYDMLLRSTPAPRIDIFARKKHFGFDAWGNNVDNTPTLETYSENAL